MPDKRCPLCGKPNPEEAETCKYCGARLKPLIKGATPGSEDQTLRRPPLVGRNASDLGDSLPDWLKDLRPSQGNIGDETGGMEGQPNEGDEPDSNAEEPDWLSRIQSNSEPAAEPIPPAELPDWLAGLGTPKPPSEPLDASNDETIPGSAPEPAAASEGLPDWLSNLGKEKSGEQESKPEELNWDFLGITPEKGTESEYEAVEEPVQDTPKAEPAEEPLQELPNAGPASEESAAPEAAPGQVEAQAAGGTPPSEPASTPAEPLPSEELPDWLKRLDTQSTPKTPGPSVPAFVEEESTPQAAPQPEEAAPVPEAPDLNALPDWIAQVPSDAEAAAEEPAGEPPAEKPEKPDQAEGIAPAELPGWLQAMRPVEAAAPPLTEAAGLTRVEKAGPLAGLRGALSVESGTISTQKPKVYSIKLQVTENQQAHMALMEELLKTEGESKPVAARKTAGAQVILRILVALVLFLAVLAPLWLNTSIAPLPGADTASPEILDASRLVSTLAPGSVVLLAFDYDPGLSGEMDIATRTLVEQLMSKNAFLAIASTSLSGPLLAERILNGIRQTTGSPYPSVANLGYVPGGASALLSLAVNPRQVLPYDLHSTDMWVNSPLQNVKTLADFAMVVVFTEKADTARSWVEQVQPTLHTKNVPLLMVVSAQAEPMVLPYYETTPKQVSGMIAGLPGFAAYESLSGQAGSARTYWDAFGSGMLVAAGLLILGGLLYGAIAGFSQQKRAEGEGGE